jgi:hypothetical protein
MTRRVLPSPHDGSQHWARDTGWCSCQKKNRCQNVEIQTWRASVCVCVRMPRPPFFSILDFFMIGGFFSSSLDTVRTEFLKNTNWDQY